MIEPELSAADQAILRHEELLRCITPPGSEMVPARIYPCPFCFSPLAMSPRPDTEVVTDGLRRNLERIAEKMDVPLVLTPAEMPTACRECGAEWEP